MISHEHRLAFVHIPKTGGSSVEIFFTGYDWITRGEGDWQIYQRERHRYSPSFGGALCDGDARYFERRLAEKHKPQAALEAELGDAWRTYTKFTFVRNPWDRLRSLYEHGVRDGAARMPATFREWILQPEPLDHMGQPAFGRWVHEYDALDFVGRFEHFARDFASLLARIGWRGPTELPHEKHGGGGRWDSRAYDAASRARVAERCADEIERFGYRFEDAFARPAAARRAGAPAPVATA